MFKNLARRSALLLALALIVAPVSRAAAQSVVSGGDPEPTGESVGISTGSALQALALAMLVTLRVA